MFEQVGYKVAVDNAIDIVKENADEITLSNDEDGVAVFLNKLLKNYWVKGTNYMDIEFVNDWLNKLKEYWFNKDIDKAVALFNKTTFYQETPFMKPYTTIEEINQEWQHVKNENIEKIEIKLLAIDDYTVIAEWILKQNDEEFDGIYEIKFNANLECVYFKSWEMIK